MKFLALVPRVVRFAAYNPNQKRAPKGTSTGGQWIDGDASSATSATPTAAIAALNKLPEDEYDTEAVQLSELMPVHDVMSDEDAYLDFQEAFSGEEGEPVTLSIAEVNKLKAVQSSITKSHVVTLIKSHAQWSKGANHAGESVKVIETKNGLFISDGHHRAVAAKLLGSGLRVKLVKAPKLSIGRGGKLSGIENYLRGLAYNPDQPRAPKGTETGGQWVDQGSSVEFPFADDAILSGKDFDRAAGKEIATARRWYREQTGNEDDESQAGKLKRGVSLVLGQALGEEFDANQLATLEELIGVGLPAGSTFQENFPGYGLSKAYVDQWAATSGDHNPLSVLYQHAVAEELDIDAETDHMLSSGALADQRSRVKAAVARELGIADRESHGIDVDFVYETMKAHARAQYANTQRYLKENGAPESFTLVRGVSMEKADAETVARTGRAALQPLSSFSADIDTASNFAAGGDHEYADIEDAPSMEAWTSQALGRGHLIRVTVPRSRIFSFPRTGFGALAEYEFVVLGTKSQAVKIGKRFGRFNKTQTEKEAARLKAESQYWNKLGMTEAQKNDPTFVPFQGREAKYNPDQPRDPKGTPTGGQWTSEHSASDIGEFDLDNTNVAWERVHANPNGKFSNFYPPSHYKHEGMVALGTALRTKVSDEDIALALKIYDPYRSVDPRGKYVTDDTSSRFVPWTEEMLAQERAEMLANALTTEWAHSSGDHNPKAVLYQHAAAEEFGLDAERGHLGEINEARRRLSQNGTVTKEQGATVERVMRAHARAQYENTQREIADSPAEWTLVRGVRTVAADNEETARPQLDSNLKPIKSIIPELRTGHASLQPLSSFTTRLSVARSFSGSGGYGSVAVMLTTRVPKSRIFSMPKTGFGSFDEREVLILGGKIRVHALGEYSYGDGWRDLKYNPDQPREPKGDPEGGQWVAEGGSISGRAIRGEMRRGTAEDRKRLGIPPAYTDVQVTDDPNAELVATARTPKGKLASFYSEAYHEKQAAKKWERIAELQRDLPGMLQQVDRDIKGKTEDRDVAMTIRLIAQTGLRNGGDAGEGVGASNLRMEHLTVSGDSVRLQFKGKGGVDQDHTVKDRTFAAYVRERQSLRLGDSARLFPHDAADTLAYQKRIGNGKYKVHDLRTYVGTTYASKLTQELIKSGAAPTTRKEYRSALKQIATHVSRKLGNTPSIALSTYIHPAAVEPLRNKVK